MGKRGIFPEDGLLKTGMHAESPHQGGLCSREEILEQRQAMLEEEIMKEDAMDDLEDANGGMSEEMDYGGAFVQ